MSGGIVSIIIFHSSDWLITVGSDTFIDQLWVPSGIPVTCKLVRTPEEQAIDSLNNDVTSQGIEISELNFEIASLNTELAAQQTVIDALISAVLDLLDNCMTCSDSLIEKLEQKNTYPDIEN